jgi:hypothetical protein
VLPDGDLFHRQDVTEGRRRQGADCPYPIVIVSAIPV